MTTYFSILPNDIDKKRLLYLVDIELLDNIKDINLDDNFWKNKLNIDFPDGKIIDEENINLVYWYYTYKKSLNIINNTINKAERLRNNNEFKHSLSILNAINQLSILGEILAKNEKIIERLEEYIYNERIKKYKSWPKFTPHLLTNVDTFDYTFINGGHIIKNGGPDGKKLINKDISSFKGNFKDNCLNLIFAYVYLYPLFEEYKIN